MDGTRAAGRNVISCAAWSVDRSVAAWFPAKAMPETNYRLENAGEEYSGEEKAGGKSKVLELWSSTEETVGETKKRTRRVNVTVPRVATFRELRMFENVLLAGTGMGFEAFDSRAEVQKYAFWQKDDSTSENADAELPLPPVIDLRPPRCLVIIGDQDGTQWAGFNLLSNKLKVCFQPLRDPYHRRWNDLSGAIRASGYYPEYYHSTVVMNNRYGPW